ncbi:MAG TPA: TrkA C-terminal domain-containing protein [Acidimicrobiia bacterium]|nr:TrkA C-terminal domain-containing protein [Acidimicrobiia bacterium]
MPEIHETALPGVGVRYEMSTTAGEHLAVVAHEHGRRDVVLYDRADPDAARESVRLTAAESTALAALLAGTTAEPGITPGRGHPVGHFTVDWVPVPPGSPFAGRSIAIAGVRSITGVSIVAVLRPESAFPAPGPDFVLEAGDTALVVGTPDGVAALIELLEA